MNTIFLAFTAILLASVHFAMAAPVTGGINFFGVITLDNTTSVNTATKVATWNTVSSSSGSSGSFAGIASGTSASFPNAMFFNSGAIANFFSIGGFTFSLRSANILAQGNGSATIVLACTVSGNGYASTGINGTLVVQNPPSGGKFTCSMAFTAVPPPPTLALIINSGGGLKIAWQRTNSGINFILQQSTNPATTNWTTTSFAITNGFGTNYCTVSPLPKTNNAFFRLTQ